MEEPAHGIRTFGMPKTFKLSEMHDEVRDMMDVLLGNEPPPIDIGMPTLMEVAAAYYARASAMEMEILTAEQNGSVSKGDRAYRFRTGQLRRLLEVCKGAQELGSRRLTALQIMTEERFG